jgi:hypothetical protein
MLTKVEAVELNGTAVGRVARFWAVVRTWDVALNRAVDRPAHVRGTIRMVTHKANGDVRVRTERSDYLLTHDRAVLLEED